MPASIYARSPLRRSLALGLSLSLAVPVGISLAPVPAEAAWAGPTEQTEETEDPALEEARKLYDEGKARFDTFDYEGAVALWTKAYGKLPPDAAGIRNSLVYNIATAQEKAFEFDDDVQHLRQAKMLLESYIDNYKALYPRTDETKTEVDKAEARIASLAERIEQSESAEPTDVRPPPAIDGTTTSQSDPELLAKNKRLADAERKTDKMLIASYVTLSVGTLFALFGMSALGGARNIEQNADPVEEPLPGEDPPPDPADTAEGLRGSGYLGLALGLAGLVTGFTLLGIGLDRRKKAKNGTLVSGTPVLGPGFAGASVRVRF